jgi:hypothetical protein
MGQIDDQQTARVAIKVGGKERIIEQGRRLVRVEQGSDGFGCRFVFKDGYLQRESCVEVRREVVTRARTMEDGVEKIDPEEGREDFLRIERSGAKARPDGAWYSDGHVRLTKNNWRGDGHCGWRGCREDYSP